MKAVGDTITLQGIELTIQEASPQKCRLCRVTLEDEDLKFAEAKQQVQEEINKRQEDILALKGQFTEIGLSMEEDIANADHLAFYIKARRGSLSKLLRVFSTPEGYRSTESFCVQMVSIRWSRSSRETQKGQR